MLYLMRHGQTDWNLQRKLQGRTDIPLNETGEKMARDAKEKYKNEHFDVCYCSPLLRANRTAELFLEGTDTPIYTDDRLMEISFGIYEGVAESFNIPDCPINTLFNEPEKYDTVEGGESLKELYDRTGEFLEEVIDPLIAERKKVLIVGHGAMNCSIICRIKGYSVEKFWDCLMGNCELLRLI